MISTSQADAFMDKLITLATSDFKTVKDMDVVLLLGGTGNGKSTVMNMIAGSKIFVAYDDNNGDWKFEAKPSIALIGHNNSMTFIPNYWQGNSLRVYDCPGFNDNRSIQHEIVKSFFIKEIADSARSIKVIVVGDIHCIHANRCAPFEDCFKQMKQLIPKFNPTTDCSLLVTKAKGRDKPKHAFQKFKSIGVQFPLEKITLVNEPLDDGEYDYSYLKFDSIITSTPTLRESCNVPLSSDALLKLIEINQELNQSVERAAAAYSNAVRRYYIEVLTSDLSISNKTMKQLYSIIVAGEQGLKMSQNPLKFIDSIKELSQRLQQIGKIKFRFEEICGFINKKYEQINYIKDKIDNFKFNMDYWIKNIHFQCESFEKSQNETHLKDTDTLQAYLRDHLKIDLNSDIKNQAHAYLNKINNFPAAYSGSKIISGFLTHSNTYTKDFEIPYVAQVQISQHIPYNGSVKYYGTKSVQVSVSVKRCNCVSKWTPNGCLLCRHSYFDVSQTRKVSYDGDENYSGQQYYSNIERQLFTAKFTEAIKENVRIKYDKSVPFSGNHTANCRDHHFCSCQRLAEMVIAAKQFFQDNSHYRNVVNFQRRELSRMKNSKHASINQDSSIIAIQDQLSINGYKFIANNLTKNEIAAQIHDQLTTQHAFMEPYKGQTTFTISKQYSDVYLCEGTKIFTNKLTHQAHVPYSSSTFYNTTKTTSGQMQVWSCYEQCSWCNQTSSMKPFSTNFHVSGYVNYAGTVKFSKTYVHNHELKFSKKVPYSGVITKQQKVVYEGNNQVTCGSSKTIGSGHHSCTSCDTWERFVAGLKKLLAIQSGLLGEIESNKREIKGLVQRQQLENSRLEQELTAKTVGQ